MKNLKIRQKLLIGIIGQLIFIGLLVFAVFILNTRLNGVSKNMMETSHELNSLKEFTSSAKDFINDKMAYEALETEYSQFRREESKLSALEDIDIMWDNLSSVAAIKHANLEIEQKVMELADKSIEQSNAYINQVSNLLADEDKRNNVSKLERLVIGGANANNNNVYSIKVLFLNVKKDVLRKDELLSFLDKSLENVKTDMKRLKNTPFESMVNAAHGLNLEIIELSNTYITNTEQINQLSNEVYSASNILFVNLSEEDINSTNRNFSGAKYTLYRAFSVLGIISIILIILNFTLSRIITRVFNQLTTDFKSISTGNLTIKLPEGFEQRKDEVGDLARSLIMLLTKLKETIGNIVLGASNIASASQQISSGSQQLSEGASEQAASVEEVSSTMEQISANIEQNTENSQQTEKKSQAAHEGINAVAERAQKSMEANKNIADKITIINDIAFQTNILALNAAVEAARAGEHGKGFAVVAAEVRKLAERSKVAAEEIVDLTQKSVDLAEGAGQKMVEILPEVEKTTKLVQEITAASIEQNNGASQVNEAVQQLNAVTQQNSAASEELATSAEEMAAQAEQLRNVVSFFNVDSDDHNTSKSVQVNREKGEKVTNSIINYVENHPKNSHTYTGNNGDSDKSAKGVLINVAQEDEKDSDYESF